MNIVSSLSFLIDPRIGAMNLDKNLQFNIFLMEDSLSTFNKDSTTSKVSGNTNVNYYVSFKVFRNSLCLSNTNIGTMNNVGYSVHPLSQIINENNTGIIRHGKNNCYLILQFQKLSTDLCFNSIIFDNGNILNYKFSYSKYNSSSILIGLCVNGYQYAMKFANNLSNDVDATLYVTNSSCLTIWATNKNIIETLIKMVEEEDNVLSQAWFQTLKCDSKLDMLQSSKSLIDLDHPLFSNHIDAIHSILKELFTHSFDYNSSVLNYNNENIDTQFITNQLLPNLSPYDMNNLNNVIINNSRQEYVYKNNHSNNKDVRIRYDAYVYYQNISGCFLQSLLILITTFRENQDLNYQKCTLWWFSIMLKCNKFLYLAGIYNKIEANDLHMKVLSSSIIISESNPNENEFDIYSNKTDSHKIECQSILKFIVVLIDWLRSQNKISSITPSTFYNCNIEMSFEIKSILNFCFILCLFDVILVIDISLNII